MVYILSPAYLWLASLLFRLGASEQKPLGENSNQSENLEAIAIVGAGISGASAAFELFERTRLSPRYRLTVFEKEDVVGGRIKTVSWNQRPWIMSEAGSSHFYAGDWCINQAIRDVGLEVVGLDPNRRSRTTGIWNGESLQQSSSCDATGTSWSDLRKYGLSPRKYHSDSQSVCSRWERFAGRRSVSNLTNELERCEFGDLVSQSASEYLQSAKISPDYSLEVVSPCVRARFMQAAKDTHSLATVMAAQAERIGPIRGGNSRLVERLIRLSSADLRLKTQVRRISLGQSKRYRLTFHEPCSSGADDTQFEEFEQVIIAPPFPVASLDLSALGLFETSTIKPRYLDVHVTNFLSAATLAPDFFNVSESTSMPDDMLVTANASQHLDLFSIGRSSKHWINRDGCRPGQLCDKVEYGKLHRVVSSHRIEDYDLISMIGGQYDGDRSLLEQGMKWVDRKAWLEGVPEYRPDTSFLEQIQPAPGLFYVGGAEGIVSSIEMSCRLGKKVAQRVYSG